MIRLKISDLGVATNRLETTTWWHARAPSGGFKSIGLIYLSLMLRNTLTIFLLLLFTFSHAQKKTKKKDNIQHRIERIHSSLESYSLLSPFSENEQRFNLIDSTRNVIIEQLLQVLNDPAIIHYDLTAFLTENNLSVSFSSDARIWFFSIDEKTGGSYRTSITLIHYRLPSGKVHAEIFGGASSEAIATSVYGEPMLVDSAQHKYIVSGGVMTCNTCIAQLAMLLTLETDSLRAEMITMYDGRSYNLEAFEYFPDEKEMLCDYLEESEDPDLQIAENDKRYRHRYHSLFKYMDERFVQVETCEYWFKE